MLDAAASLEAKEKDRRSVSPISSHSYHASTTSTSSWFDGTPTSSHLSASSLPTRPHSSPPSLDMTIRPACVPAAIHHGGQLKAKRPRVEESEREDQPYSALPSPPPELGETTSASHLPSLSQIAQSLRQRQYLSRRSKRAQAKLRLAQVTNAWMSRHLANAHSVQRTLADCVKSEDKESFVTLSNASHEALSCREPTPELEDLVEDTNDHGITFQSTVLDGLSSRSRGAILDLVGKIRHDGNFLASALAMLTHKELLALLPTRNPGQPTESIFGSTNWPTSRTSRHLGYAVDSQMESLGSMTYGSSLELLVHSVRGISGSPEYECKLSMEIWSTVCGRLLVEQKPGSEKLVPAVLDIWATFEAWPGKSRLETWMLETLQSASFLTDQPAKQTFRMRAQMRQQPPDDGHSRSEAFYSQAVESLFALLADRSGPSVIPQSVLDLCQAIGRKMHHSPGQQRGLAHFIVLRWLFSPFFFDVLTLPEAYGMMLDCYISEMVRTRVFREIATRAQKTIFNVAYPWKYGVQVPIATSSRVQAVMDRFQVVASDLSSQTQNDYHIKANQTPQKTICLVVSVSDILGIVNALLPARRPISVSSDQDTIHSGLNSSASSVSGFSMFRQSSSVGSPGLDFATPALEDVIAGAGDTCNDLSSGNETNGEYDKKRIDVVHIREAYAELEDAVNTMLIEKSDQWVTLVATPSSAKVETCNDIFFERIASAKSSPDHMATPLDTKAMEVLIEHVLLEGEEEGHSDMNGFRLPLSFTEASLYDQLLAKLHSRILSARDRSDFLDELARIHDLRDIEAYTAERQDLHALLNLLSHIESRVQQDLERQEAILEVCECQLGRLQPHLDRSVASASVVAETVDHLRDKMWYLADVRTSAAYDESRSIASALKVMGIPKQSMRTRLSTPLRHLSGSKISGTGFHLKGEAQILELLSTPPDQGGPNKLSDEQSRSTSAWMERNNVENLCRSEERLHKLTMEIRKCVDQLMVSDGAMIWSNDLFTREKASLANQRKASASSLSALQATASRYRQLSLHTNLAPSIDTVSSASHPLSTASSRDFMESRSPALTSKSSVPFWSPAVTEAQSPSSATSVGSVRGRGLPVDSRKWQTQPARTGVDVLAGLRSRLTSLLLSDLAAPLFNEGSESDRAFWDGLGGQLTSQHLDSRVKADEERIKAVGATSPQHKDIDVRSLAFDFPDAFKRLLRAFAATCDPSVKLGILYDVDRLLIMQATSLNSGRTREDPRDQEAAQPPTSLSLAERCVNGFHDLFSDSQTRPHAIFRDLQYIAALIPTSILETTPQGKAFWNAAVAISRLKRSICAIMVETADNIIAYHSNNRGHGQQHSRTSSTAQQQRDSATFTTPTRTPSAEDIARYSMADAALLLQITAKEGDPAAQRELATLYLTHPELMDHIIAPFAKSKDVFKDELEGKWRKDRDPHRCDPITMCVAHHWMVESCRGGDALAKEYLRQREEMERLP